MKNFHRMTGAAAAAFGSIILSHAPWAEANLPSFPLLGMSSPRSYVTCQLPAPSGSTRYVNLYSFVPVQGAKVELLAIFYQSDSKNKNRFHAERAAVVRQYLHDGYVSFKPESKPIEFQLSFRQTPAPQVPEGGHYFQPKNGKHERLELDCEFNLHVWHNLFDGGTGGHANDGDYSDTELVK